jgi:hypothetical protein
LEVSDNIEYCFSDSDADDICVTDVSDDDDDNDEGSNTGMYELIDSDSNNVWLMKQVMISLL